MPFASLFIRAYFQLFLTEVYFCRGDFKGLYERVRNHPICRRRLEAGAVPKLCEAMDLACIWYWRHAFCLQRSAALACFLKRYGIDANVVIGAQQMPFRSHAWVEVNGVVMNDKPYVSEVFAVLDRC
jgi:hypothetical protein